VHAAGLFDEQAERLGHYCFVLQDVLQGRHAGARWMGALARLGELPWIADEDEVPGGVGDGKAVGERHLPGLVHDQSVDSRVGLARAQKKGVPPRT
jgi:hypothetical protein